MRIWKVNEPSSEREVEAIIVAPDNAVEDPDDFIICASCGAFLKRRAAYASGELRIRYDKGETDFENPSEGFPALVCPACARAEGQDVSEPLADSERIEALERNLGKLTGALRELTGVVRYILDGDETVSE